MRIVYGANSQGNGHLSKAAVLLPELAARGHEVLLVTSGPTPSQFVTLTSHRVHYAGLPYVIESGRTANGPTAAHWIRSLPTLAGDLFDLRRRVREFQPDLVLSDFEPLTASPLLQPGCEVVSFCRQLALVDKQLAMPTRHGFEQRLTKAVVKLFTANADRTYGLHYAPESVRCVPPILRPEILSARPTLGEHWLVYSHLNDPTALIQWADHRRQPVKAYGFAAVPRGRVGLVEFCPPSHRGMLEDLSSCRGVITNAGLTTPLEGILLGKPVVVVPIRHQWEQIVNASQLEQFGLAASRDDWDFDALLTAEPVRDDHPLRTWLSNPPTRLLDVLLGQYQPAAILESRHKPATVALGAA